MSNQNEKQVSELLLVLDEDRTQNAIVRLSNEWISGTSEVRYKYNLLICQHSVELQEDAMFCMLSVIKQNTLSPKSEAAKLDTKHLTLIKS